MKAILEYTWDIEHLDEKYDYVRAMKGEDAFRMISDFEGYLRTKWKHEDMSDEAFSQVEQIWEKLHELKDVYGLDAEELR